MQVKFLSCLVACLALLVVVLAEDQPTVQDVDVLHAKCYRSSMIMEGEEVDSEAMQVTWLKFLFATAGPASWASRSGSRQSRKVLKCVYCRIKQPKCSI